MGLALSPADKDGLFDAFDRSHAILELTLDGLVIGANDVFLQLMGYHDEDVVGCHYGMLVPPDDAVNAAYRQAWNDLRAGGRCSGKFRRIARDGRELWFEGTFDCIRDDAGNPSKILEFSRDVTRQHRDSLDKEGQVRAIYRSQAVIEFDTDGVITDANENFLAIAGYRRDEIRGKHHRMFVDPAETSAQDHALFWRELAAGSDHTGEFRRLGKNGKPFWIRASYNPILDRRGKPTRVIKFAHDITRDVEAAERQHIAVEAADSLFRDIMGRVSGIAKGIEGITKQTKLLALNARIEAARVGNEGRSFAVVANEISNLSGRTAGSASEISDLIRRSDERARALYESGRRGKSGPHDAPLALPAARG